MNGAVARRMHFQMFSGISRMAARRPGELYYIGGSDVLPAPLDPEREASWPDLTADEGALFQLAYRLQRTGVAWIHLQDLIDDLLS